ncbi:MAG: spore coat associated protein CotJA [Clostridia bacterium]
MYNCRYKNCCCQKHYNQQVIETACNDCGTTADFHTATAAADDACDCGFDMGESVFPTNPMYAQSYVPIQYMDKTFTPCVGLKMGTIFPELVSPYAPGQSVEENAFIRAMNTIGEGCNKC